MAKYSSISAYLAERDQSLPYRVHFSELERVIAAPLPKSARQYQAWWANQSGQGHTQAFSWCGVGWRTGDVDLQNEQVTFLYVGDAMTKQPKVSASVVAKSEGITIDEAKMELSLTFGVRPDQIEITIKG